MAFAAFAFAMRAFSAEPLHDACRRSDADEVRSLLQKDATVINAVTGSPRRSALHWAVRGRASQKEARLAVVRQLLDRGADVNAADGDEETVLQAACQPGWDEALLDLLLTRGAVIDRNGATKGNFRHEGAPLHRAAARCDVRLVEFLVKHGADPNVPYHINGATPLMVVFGPPTSLSRWNDFADERRRNDAVQILKLLHGKGADLKRANGEGAQPIHYAAGAHHLPAIRWLLAQGADAAALAMDGRTVLHFAASNSGKVERETFAALLAASKLPIDTIDKNRRTPLHAAVVSSSNQAVQSLLLLGANPALRDSKDQRPVDLDKYLPLEPATMDMLRRYTPPEESPAEPPKETIPPRLVI